MTTIRDDEEALLDPAGAPEEPGGWSRGRLILGAVVVLAALAGTVAVVALMVTGGDQPTGLLVRNGDGSISLLDEATGEARYQLPGATPTPDRTALLTTRKVGGSTVLESRDPQTAEATGSTTLVGDLRVRTISPNGTAVVLMPDDIVHGGDRPVPRDTTPLTVAFLDTRPPLQFDLPGNIEPEMFSLDETTLFVLDFVPADDPTSYYIREVDLATGHLSDTYTIQVDIESRMNGRAHAQVLHPDGTFLYTLYTLPPELPVNDHTIEATPSDDTDRWAFVHVISLDEKWSMCVFLPAPFGRADQGGMGMAVAPDGRSVMVADPSIGQVAVIDTTEHTVAEVHQLDQLYDTGARVTMAVAADGTVYLSSGYVVLELDRRTWTPVHAWSRLDQDGGYETIGIVTGLSVTDDVLRVAGGGRVVVIDRRSRAEVAVMGEAERGTVELLGPPGGSVTEFPLECAC